MCYMTLNMIQKAATVRCYRHRTQCEYEMFCKYLAQCDKHLWQSGEGQGGPESGRTRRVVE